MFALEKAAGDTSKSLYDRNRAVYDLLRYGVKVKPDISENTETVWLIDWKRPERNHFAIAEEVTVSAADAKAHTKRPDVVMYVNGIALGVLELKRSTISLAQGIRQNLDNQNLELAKKPVRCLEYIVVHELVHLLERHHNDTFTALMNKFLPQWKLRRNELNAAPLAHEMWSY